MSHKIADATRKRPTKSIGVETLWSRVTFAGLVAGNPPRATFHSVGTLRDGRAKQFSQAVPVTDDSLVLPLAKLPAGSEIRTCTETDWDANGIPVTLRDFYPVQEVMLLANPTDSVLSAQSQLWNDLISKLLRRRKGFANNIDDCRSP